MQENKHDTDGAHIFHQEEIDMEQTAIIECSPVGEFVAHNLMWYKPTNQDTGQEAHDKTVTIRDAILRVAPNSSSINAVLTSCSDINDVKAAIDSRT